MNFLQNMEKEHWKKTKANKNSGKGHRKKNAKHEGKKVRGAGGKIG